MPNTPTRRSSQESTLCTTSPLTRTAKAKTPAQLRAERKQIEARLSWDIDKVIAEQDSASSQISATDAPSWGTLLDAINKHSAGAWTLFDKALAPYCMGAPGPMDPKTGQYVTEIRIAHGQAGQVEKVLEGVESLLPSLKASRGQYEFRIKVQNLKYREKNWLSMSKDGKCQVLSTLHPSASFDDLRSALMFICEHRPAA